jgi:hypothetical protein
MLQPTLEAREVRPNAPKESVSMTKDKMMALQFDRESSVLMET